MLDEEKSHIYPSGVNMLGYDESVTEGDLLEILLHAGETDHETIEQKYPLMFPTFDAMGQHVAIDDFQTSLEHARTLFSLAVETHAGRLESWLDSDENGKSVLVDEIEQTVFYIGFFKSSGYSRYLASWARTAGGVIPPARITPETMQTENGGAVVDVICLLPSFPYGNGEGVGISRAFSDSLVTLGIAGKREIIVKGKRSFFYPANIVQAWDALAERIGTQTVYFCSVCGRAAFTKKQPWAKNFPDTCGHSCRQKKYLMKREAAGRKTTKQTPADKRTGQAPERR